MTLNKQISTLISNHSHCPEAVAAIKELVDVFDVHLLKLLKSAPKKRSIGGACPADLQHDKGQQMITEALSAIDAEITAIQTKYADNPAAYQDALAAPGIVAQQLANRNSLVLKAFLADIKQKHSPEVAVDLKRIVRLLTDGFLAQAESLLAVPSK